MKTQAQWFNGYSSVHQHPRNRAIHWACVPLIFACVVAWLCALPSGHWPGLWGAAAALLATGFYLTLSLRIAIAMLAWMALNVVICAGLVLRFGATTVAVWALAVFVLAWVGQFVGHVIEGRKPSFFTDLAYLLVGPAWLMEKLLAGKQ